MASDLIDYLYNSQDEKMLATVKLAYLFCEHGLTKRGQNHTIEKEAVRVLEAVELTVCPS